MLRLRSHVWSSYAPAACVAFQVVRSPESVTLRGFAFPFSSNFLRTQNINSDRSTLQFIQLSWWSQWKRIDTRALSSFTLVSSASCRLSSLQCPGLKKLSQLRRRPGMCILCEFFEEIYHKHSTAHIHLSHTYSKIFTVCFTLHLQARFVLSLLLPYAASHVPSLMHGSPSSLISSQYIHFDRWTLTDALTFTLSVSPCAALYKNAPGRRNKPAHYHSLVPTFKHSRPHTWLQSLA